MASARGRPALAGRPARPLQPGVPAALPV